MRKKEPPHPIRVAKTIDVIARYEEGGEKISIIQSQTQTFPVPILIGKCFS